MHTPPRQPKIYHITHVDNLSAILGHKKLLSDAEMVKGGGPKKMIGMSRIKKRRLEELEVDCHSGHMVGEFVPFYFCPRSVMLFLIYRRNPELQCQEGQGPIVHLEADLHKVVDWAGERDRKWAFSLSNAGAYYTEFRDKLPKLNEINWPAVANNDFRTAAVKEGKQAEFLVYKSFPWKLVDRIGVLNNAVAQQAGRAIEDAGHYPKIEIMRDWYF
jgi:ssDNA thymidine ADP-ribosyltransferase, DarT